MQFTTTGSVPRLDLTLMIEVIETLRAEWAALQFAPDGNVINPLTSQPVDTLRLAEGRHRASGARYEIVTRTPVMAVDPEQQSALQAELLTATDIDWDEYGRRLTEITVPTGEISESRTTFTLRHDDARTLAVTVADPSGLWSVDVDIVHGRLPRVQLAGRLDATKMLMAEGTPTFLARRLGGTGTGTATIDLGTIERAGGGTLAEGSGRLNRFSADGSATVRTTARSWDVEGQAELTGTGLGRLVLRFMRRRIQTAADAAVAQWWDGVPSTVVGAQTAIREAERLIEQEGGLARVVHHTLWEEGYADRMEATYPPESKAAELG
ncbi:hypothetical protein GEV29_04180 [Aeromicrobium sp. SMF47]|uniref:hypothetical protein n=1 Tax=Aeromicrobium yanjiei TaxID=2662028 RepID=UPI00129DF4FB|nr:hypothetical protein [Aeromicrobium yanjiei]MRJ75723.1 hypothetical protein [Aeromicrobium yanjiei]